jgi:hypothetical protein
MTMLDSWTVKLTQDMTVEEFYDWHTRHSCCNENHRDWAVENCQTMQECWHKLSPLRLIWVATRPGVLKPKECRLFAIFCCRVFWHLLQDERSRNAVEVAERYAFDTSIQDELKAAHTAANKTIYRMKLPADRDLAKKMITAARAAWWTSSVDARISAIVASRLTLEIANTAEARDALRLKYANWLRKHTKPSFWFTPLSILQESNDG